MDSKTGEFKKFCRLYYINAVLSSRLQALLQQRIELGQSLMRADLSVSTIPTNINICAEITQKTTWRDHIDPRREPQESTKMRPKKVNGIRAGTKTAPASHLIWRLTHLKTFLDHVGGQWDPYETCTGMSRLHVCPPFGRQL